MSQPTNAREALLAEALGDVAHLLDRLESVAPALDEARGSLLEAADALRRRADAFDTNVAAVTQTAKIRVMQQIAIQTSDIARRSVADQTCAMTEAAQRIFDAQVNPALQRLTGSLQQVLKQLDRPRDVWLLHAATAAVSSAVTLAVVMYLMHK